MSVCDDKPCAIVQVLKTEQTNLKEDLNELKTTVKDEVVGLLRTIKNHVPPWVAVGFGVCGAIIGSCITIILGLMG